MLVVGGGCPTVLFLATHDLFLSLFFKIRIDNIVLSFANHVGAMEPGTFQHNAMENGAFLSPVRNFRDRNVLIDVRWVLIMTAGHGCLP